MRYVHCAKCKTVQKYAWPPRSRCLICGEELRMYTVRSGPLTYLMYATSGMALALVLMRLWNYPTGLGDLDWVIIFGSLLVAFACSYLENERGHREMDSRLKAQRR